MPIPTPLPNITRHIIKPIIIGGKGSDRTGVRKNPIVIDRMIAVDWIEVVAAVNDAAIICLEVRDGVNV